MTGRLHRWRERRRWATGPALVIAALHEHPNSSAFQLRRRTGINPARLALLLVDMEGDKRIRSMTAQLVGYQYQRVYRLPHQDPPPRSAE